MEIKLEINKCDPIKLTSFCTRKETIKQRQPTEWKRTFATDVTDNDLISKLYIACILSH